MSKMDIKTAYQRIKSELILGVRSDSIYEKEERSWKKIPDINLPIKIRKMFTKEESDMLSTANISELIGRLKQDPELQLEFTEDSKEHYVNVNNGIFDVEAGELVNDEQLNFGYSLKFDYIEPNKRQLQHFEKFVKTSFPDDLEIKKRLLLEILGYCISDYAKAKTGFFLIGESNSGKSTILELLQGIMPEQAVTAIPLYRLDNRFNLARLAEAKLNVCTELSEKSFAATDVFKMLTSNEIVTAEHKGKKPFEFRLRCKTINAGNMIPDIDKVEGMEAILNRMTLLLFPVSIPKDKQDMKLSKKLWEERDSIFSEALDSLFFLAEGGFNFDEPNDSKRIKDQMRARSNCVQDFVSERCVLENKEDARVYSVLLYEAFKSYCTENLLDVKLTKTQFLHKIGQLPGVIRGKIRVEKGKPLAGFKFIRLKKEEEYTLQDSQTYYAEKSGSEKKRNNGTTEQEEK